MGDFVPGVYAAVYDFEPELETEMRIVSGEIVTVLSRQCAGWVQAGRVLDGQITGEVGLVPENYLALIESDDQRAAASSTSPLYDLSAEGEGEGVDGEIEKSLGVTEQESKWAEESRTPRADVGEGKEREYGVELEPSGEAAKTLVEEGPVVAKEVEA
ncbi:hypothetical protein BCR35DRAFT_299102 [Leucosporidium creatinivorum]|uniref:SH3 domain-containing protein n=1 Tax=Leucosporidium creatinivorum TaxID=106004 RepID=A0A1Y2G315_9BASI|nr:hypothetical protein BCR35DRAFT_299102 [Leucosporidium creatinivorum]